MDLGASDLTGRWGKRNYTRVLEENTVVVDVSTTLKYTGFKPLHMCGNRGQLSF